MPKLVVCDLNAIENRAVGWASRCDAILEVHRAGRDPYLEFGTKLYPMFTYEELLTEYESGNDEKRQNCKAPVLGGGFGLGGGELYVNEYGDTVRGGMWGYALNVCGVDMTRELAHEAVKIFRDSYPEVVQFWRDLEEGFKQTLMFGRPVEIGKVTWRKQWVEAPNQLPGAVVVFERKELNGRPVIRMVLPSGRSLHYLNASMQEEEFTYTDKKSGKKKTSTGTVLYYDGIEHSATQDAEGNTVKKKMKWGRTKTYGGKLCENFVQGIARDILLNSMKIADEMGFKLIGCFHDEIATEVEDDPFAPGLEDLRFCMSEAPPWAPTLLLDAAGWSGRFYRKG
jgi:DNA polymerase